MSQWNLLDLFRESLGRRLSQPEAAWVETQRQHYPYLVLPTMMLARQQPTGDTLFRAAVYAPDRNQLRQYVKGRLCWSGPAAMSPESDSVVMSEPATSTFGTAHVPPLFCILPPSAVAPVADVVPFGILPSRQEGGHAYLNQLCQEQQRLAQRVTHQVQQQMATYHAQASTDPPTADWPSSYASTLPIAPDAPASPRSAALIDRFLAKKPTLPRPQVGDASPSLPVEHHAAQASNAFDDTLATETLARLYLRQGNRTEAIRVYQQLRLRFPEKSDYFDAQINQLSHT